MARKKAPGRAPDNRVNIIMLKDTPEYRAWFDALSDATLIDSAIIVRDALAKWAKERGLPDPPAGPIRPRRKRPSH